GAARQVSVGRGDDLLRPRARRRPYRRYGRSRDRDRQAANAGGWAQRGEELVLGQSSQGAAPRRLGGPGRGEGRQAEGTGTGARGGRSRRDYGQEPGDPEPGAAGARDARRYAPRS